MLQGAISNCRYSIEIPNLHWQDDDQDNDDHKENIEPPEATAMAL